VPELPEVEVIVSGLRDKLIGLKLEEVQVLRPQVLEETTPQELNRHLLGQPMTQVSRRGKYILIRFANGCTLTTHLRMTGRYLLFDTPRPPDPYTKLCFNLSQHKQLQYQDKRSLGKIRLYRPGERPAVLEALGVEPLENEFTLNYLSQRLRRHKKQIKPLLLEQKLIAGIGNIYASEILFAARISPLRRADELNRAEIKRLHQAVRRILSLAIASQGTHISDYVNAEGKPGNFAEMLKVYGRGGEECGRCGDTVLRIVQQQRSSYYCPGCQG
jgi:formamidopyrimidine-DNA glycosylase